MANPSQTTPSEYNNHDEQLIWKLGSVFFFRSLQNVHVCINHTSKMIFQMYFRFWSWGHIHWETKKTQAARPRKPRCLENELWVPASPQVEAEDMLYRQDWTSKIACECVDGFPDYGNFGKLQGEWKIPIWIIKQVQTDTSIYLIVAAARILGQKALFCTCKLQLSANRFFASLKVTCYLVQYQGMKGSGRWWSLSFHLALPYSNRKGHVITSMSWQRKFHIVSLRCDVTS